MLKDKSEAQIMKYSQSQSKWIIHNTYLLCEHTISSKAISYDTYVKRRHIFCSNQPYR